MSVSSTRKCTNFSSLTPFDFVLQGLHPRIIAEGFEAAKEKALAALEEVKVTQEMDRETLINVARTSLRTKVHKELADLLTEVRHEGTELSVWAKDQNFAYSTKNDRFLSCCYSL